MQRVTSVVLAGLLLLGLAEAFIPSGPVESSRATLRPLQASRRADDQVSHARPPPRIMPVPVGPVEHSVMR